MVKCAVKMCKNDSRIKTKLNGHITYHRFPKDRKLTKKWVDAIKRTGPDWEPNIWTRICSVHFPDSNIYKTQKGLCKLVNNAVPSLFLHQITSPGYQSDVIAPLNSDLMNDDVVALPLLQQRPPEEEIRSDMPRNDASQPVPDITETDTPRKRKLKKEIIRLADLAKQRRMRYKTLFAANRRLKQKVHNLSEVLSELKEKRLVNQEQVDILEVCGASAAALFKRMVHKGKEYPLELRTFALTLHFYSPRAYSYVRDTFNTRLPHQSTLKKWYQCVNARPGFTAETFEVLGEKVQSSNKTILCNLVIDEMSIRQLKEYDGNTIQGYVDFGAGFDEPGDLSALCTQALVFLLVAINEQWKVPVGYFLVNGVTGEQRANLVKICLSNCHDVGIEVISMTFDGCPANFAMARELGCSFDYKGVLKTYFTHPTTTKPVNIFLDPAHMLKLVRNTLESKKNIQDTSNGDLIKWQYFKDLHTLQENENFHLANKLTKRHMDFKSQIMKVKLAAQLLSASVAKAIQFCDKKLHILNFANSDATVKFISIMNNLFDILNSRKFPGIDFKAPINEKNEIKYLKFLENTKKYLENLQIEILGSKQPIMCTRNKVGFLGLYVCINSMTEIYHRLVKQEKILKFIPMYKLSQDHLETFFSVIRSHGGFNNNPSATQFMAIYKKLLIHMELKESFRGNCSSLEQITLLSCSSSANHINMTAKGYRAKEKADMVDEQFMANFEEEPLRLPIVHSILSEYVMPYIAGYVVRYLLTKLKCIDCLGALVAQKTTRSHSFILIKDRGGLIYPAEDVIKICNATETVVKVNIDANNKADRDPRNMVTKALQSFIGSDIFSVLHTHLFEQEPCSNHLLHLLRAVIQKYVDIRVKYLVRKSNVKESKRQLYNKLTLFKGQ